MENISLKKIIALFALVPTLCLTGCSESVKYISEDDDRAKQITQTGSGSCTPLDARLSVYSGKYESFDISEPDITRVIGSLGNDSFVVVKGSEPLLGNPSPNDVTAVCEYGVYTLGKGYRDILPKYSAETERKVSYIIACGSGYVLYISGIVNDAGVLVDGEYCDLHLLKPDEMTDKIIYKLPGHFNVGGAITEETVYFDTAADFQSADKLVMSYDIANDELSTECRYAERPFVCKNKAGYFIDGKAVSYSAPMFDPAKYGFEGEYEIIPTGDATAYTRKAENNTIVGYIAEDKRFDIFSAENTAEISNICFSDGCAVWELPNDYLPPVFYSDEYKSLVIVDAEKADYAGFADGGKMYFFGKNDGDYSRVLTINISDI